MRTDLRMGDQATDCCLITAGAIVCSPRRAAILAAVQSLRPSCCTAAFRAAHPIPGKPSFRSGTASESSRRNEVAIPEFVIPGLEVLMKQPQVTVIGMPRTGHVITQCQQLGEALHGVVGMRIIERFLVAGPCLRPGKAGSLAGIAGETALGRRHLRTRSIAGIRQDLRLADGGSWGIG